MLRVLSVLAVVGVFAACNSLRVQEGVYANLTEARDAGAITHGWVPEGLPPSAGDLREGHLPDGRRWGTFTFATADDAAVRALTRSEVTSGSLECDPPGRLEWWPRILRTPIDVDHVKATAFHLYRGTDGSLFAINWNDGRGYYWSP